MLRLQLRRWGGWRWVPAAASAAALAKPALELLLCGAAAAALAKPALELLRCCAAASALARPALELLLCGAVRLLLRWRGRRCSCCGAVRLLPRWRGRRWSCCWCCRDDAERGVLVLVLVPLSRVRESDECWCWCRCRASAKATSAGAGAAASAPATQKRLVRYRLKVPKRSAQLSYQLCCDRRSCHDACPARVVSPDRYGRADGVTLLGPAEPRVPNHKTSWEPRPGKRLRESILYGAMVAL